jgi:hypothetical protein
LLTGRLRRCDSLKSGALTQTEKSPKPIPAAQVSRRNFTSFIVDRYAMENVDESESREVTAATQDGTYCKISSSVGLLNQVWEVGWLENLREHDLMTF